MAPRGPKRTRCEDNAERDRETPEGAGSAAKTTSSNGPRFPAPPFELGKFSGDEWESPEDFILRIGNVYCPGSICRRTLECLEHRKH